MGFEQALDDPTFKHMDALRKMIQSLVDYVLNHCFWTFKQGLNYFRSPIWFALISTRGVTLDKLQLPRSLSLLHRK